MDSNGDTAAGVTVPNTKLARDATARGIELASLSPEELRKAHPEFGDDVSAWLDPARAVDRRDVVGGPARTQILGEIDRIARELS